MRARTRRAPETVSSSGATSDPRPARGPAHRGPRGLRLPARDRAARRGHRRLLRAAAGRGHRPGLDHADVHRGRVPGRRARVLRAGGVPGQRAGAVRRGRRLRPQPPGVDGLRGPRARPVPAVRPPGHAGGLRGRRPSGPPLRERARRLPPNPRLLRRGRRPGVLGRARRTADADPGRLHLRQGRGHVVPPRLPRRARRPQQHAARRSLPRDLRAHAGRRRLGDRGDVRRALHGLAARARRSR